MLSLTITRGLNRTRVCRDETRGATTSLEATATWRYLDGGRGVEHVLQGEVAAVVQVVFAEFLNELEVVQSISQRHVLLQTHVWGGEKREPSDIRVTAATSLQWVPLLSDHKAEV